MNEGGTLANESKSADSADTTRKEKAKVLERIRSRINSEREWWKDMRNVCEVYETFNPRFVVPNSNLSSPRLPWEICLLVLDHINDYTSGIYFVRMTLWSCCLTCQGFYLPSCRYLYRTVEINNSWMFQSFIQSITNKSHLRGLTTHLHFFQPVDLGPISNSKAFHQLFLHGQALLPNLQLLSLYDMPLLHPTLLCLRRHFASVTELRVQRCKFSSILDVRRFIDNFFPILSILDLNFSQLQFSHVTPIIQSLPGCLRNTPSLSYLRMTWSQINVHSIQRWLSLTPTRISLRSLDIKSDQLMMLLSFGQNLQTLDIYWEDGFKCYQDEALSFGYQLLPVLELICVYFRSDTAVSQFCTMFSRSLPSPTLSSLEITCWEKVKTLTDLDDTLSILPRHTKVEISVHAWESLPKLKKNGMLVALTVDMYSRRRSSNQPPFRHL
ncbi:hypothetical protein C8Q75DRAFT_785005 [Abortiporus biennis]|nr:hypothetical protein C8Q75DRAFT_785005 [Abortiporus biennis]